MTAYDWATRSVRAEVMDRDDLDAARHAQALRGLATINRVSRSTSVVWREIRRLVRDCRLSELSILDLASGGGDVTLGLWRQARKARLEVRVVGLDRSPRAVELARRRARGMSADVEFRVHDVLSQPIDEAFDVVVTSLFLHHLEQADAAAMLERMRTTARRLVVVNDLVRSRAGYWMVVAATRVLTQSEVVRFDGPVSVANGFHLDEMRSLAERAGMSGARIDRRWPCRLVLSWRKPT